MANQILTKTTTPTLTWAAIPGASQYEVQFSTDQRFKTTEQDLTGLATPTVTPSALTNAAKHFWRFRALLSTTLYADQSNLVNVGTNNIRDVAGNTYLAQGVTPTVGLPIKRIAVGLIKIGGPVGNIWVELWSSSGGAPAALVSGATSAVLNVNTIFGGYANYNFDFPNPIPVVAGTLYYIVLRGDWAINGADYLQWGKDAAGSYANGSAFKGDGTPVFSANGTPDQTFTTYYYTWDLWQPMRSIWINTGFSAAYTPASTGFVLVDPDDTTDVYALAVAPAYDINPQHQRRAQVRNIQGDLLTEYVSTRDVIVLANDDASYCKYDQAAEILRFFHKRKSFFLIVKTDYFQDVHERVWKVDHTQEPQIQPLASGRNDFFKVVQSLEESILT